MIDYLSEALDDKDAIEALLDQVFGADRFMKKSYLYRNNIPPWPDLCWVA
jgi:hypothetical protein